MNEFALRLRLRRDSNAALNFIQYSKLLSGDTEAAPLVPVPARHSRARPPSYFLMLAKLFAPIAYPACSLALPCQRASDGAASDDQSITGIIASLARSPV